MNKTFKSFVYVIACVAVFLVIAKSYNSSFPIRSTNSATAFEWEKTVNVYFLDLQEAKTKNCEAKVAVPRKILNAETLGPGALEALIKGPTASEKTRLMSAIYPDTLIQQFEVRDKVAYVDFNSNLNAGIAGACNVTAIRSAIENTLNALPDIDKVIISVNGKTEGILEP